MVDASIQKKIQKRIKSLSSITATILLVCFIILPIAPAFAQEVSSTPFKNATPDPSVDSRSLDVSQIESAIQTSAAESHQETTSEELDNSDENGPQPPSLLSGSNATNPHTESERQVQSNLTIEPGADGSLTSVFPIVVPPGRGDMTPDLKLVYSSQNNANGAFGYGWSINIPSIEHINKHGIDLMNTERYFSSSLDGELASSTLASTTYYARVDNGDYVKYSYNASSTYWTATYKNGTVFTYGLATSTRQASSTDSSVIHKWMLEEIRDTNGNYIKYEYYSNGGQIYPYRITYTGNGVTDGVFTVTFLRESRTDSRTSYKDGFGVTTSYRIYEIDIAISGTWEKKYAITYGYGVTGGRSLIQTITESGQDESANVITLPSNYFGYSSSTPSYKPASFDYAFSVPTTEGRTFVDLNGDGLQDVLNTPGGGGSRLVYINDITTFDVDFGWSVPCDINTSSSPTPCRLGDVNGDGLPDIIYSLASTSTSDTRVYLNTGSTFRQDAAWSAQVPVNIVWTDGGSIQHDGGVVLADLNGDGLIDIIHGDDGPTTPQSFLNTGTGWFGLNTTRYYDNSSLVSQPITYIDVNGDGLADRVYAPLSSPGNVQINNGYTLALDSNWNVPGTINNPTDDLGYRFADVNGDGLVDIQFGDTASTTHSVSYINNGAKWLDGDTVYGPPVDFVFTNGGGTRLLTGSIMTDINGDGLADGMGDISSTYSRINRGPIIDLLTSATSSSGLVTNITYKASTQHLDNTTKLNPNLPITIQTVSQTKVTDGISPSLTTGYSYEGGRYFYEKAVNRRFAGFNLIKSTTTAGITTKTYFHQASSTDTSHGAYSDDEWKIGKPYRVEVYDSSDNLYSKTINKWVDTDLGNGRRFVNLAQSVQSAYDGGSTHRDVAEANTYETTYGNLIQNIKYGEVTGSDDGTFSDTGSDIASTTISYAASTTLYIVGLPSAETTQNQSLTKIKETKHYYDSLSSGSVSKGNETKIENWATSTTYASTSKTYDGTYGLVTQSRDPNNNLTIFTLDSLNLYPATTTNALSQTTGYTYDYATGKVKNTFDANSKLFTTTYDALRRPLTINIPDPSTGSLVTKTSYSYTDSATPGSTYIQETNNLNSATTSVNYTYFDGFGRKLQERKQADPISTYAVTDYVYNNLGLLASTSLPYFSSSTARTTATTSAKMYTQLTYDPLQRITQTVNAVGTTTTAYVNWRTRVTDALGHVKDFWKDAFSNLQNVVENNGTTTATTTYAYDAANNLTKITDAAANIRNFTYDGLSRRLTSEDLHTAADTLFGTSTYTYDDAGNITQFKDPRNQTTNYTYDSLNRKLTEDYTGQSGTEVSFTYDSCTNGKGRLCFATTTNNNNSVYSSKTYNAIGLVATDTKQIASQVYNTAYVYDRLGDQTTITYPDSSQVRYTFGSSLKPLRAEQRETGSSAWRNIVTNVQYSPVGMETEIDWGSGATTTYTYDANSLYRLTNILTIAPAAGSGGGGFAMLMGGGGEGEMSNFALSTVKNSLAVALPGHLAQALMEEVQNQTTVDSTELELPEVTANVAEELTPDNVEDVATTTLETITEIGTTTAEALPVEAQEKQIVGATTTSELSEAERIKDFEMNPYNEEGGLYKFSALSQISNSEVLEISVLKSTPEVRFKKWNGEAEFGISYKDVVGKGSRKVMTDRVEWKDTSKEVYAYPVKGTENGGFEFEVALNEKPISNVFNFAIDGAENFDFLYQPPLSEDEKDSWTDHCTDTECFDKNGSTTASRPENIVGSYAVYSKNLLGNIEGGTNYASGKVAHILRPKAIDANGNETWCTMNYKEGTLAVTCPQEFLDSATYPVTVDPTIGYNTIGASNVNVVDDVIFCSNRNTSASVTGPISNVQFYGKKTSADSKVRSGIYTTANALQSPTSSEQTINSTTAQWWVNSWSGPTVASSTSYMPCTFFNAVSNNITVYYDTGSSGDSKVQITSYPTWPTTFVPGDSTRRYSIYASYSTSTTPAQTLQNISYTYDAMGNITNITDYSTSTGHIVSFTYDDLNRLLTASTTAASSTAYRYQYAYDALGNITASKLNTNATTTYTYAGTNYANPDAATTIGSTSYTYDNAGNMTVAGSNTYNWDWRGHLATSTVSTVIRLYNYDEDDHRMRLEDATTVYHYPNDLYQTDSVSALPTKHVFLNGKDIATIEGSTGSGVPTYRFPDHLGSTHIAIDKYNTVQQGLSYYPYGAKRISSGTDVSQREYIGQFYDEGPALSYLNARYYDPARGQFVSQDPVFLGISQNLVDPQSLNSYSYANDNPIINKDPEGKSTRTALEGVLSNFDNLAKNPSQAALLVASGVALTALAPEVALIAGIAIGSYSLGNSVYNAYNAADSDTRDYYLGQAVTTAALTGTSLQGTQSGNVLLGSKQGNELKITTAYKRPSGATTQAQREFVNQKGTVCVTCGKTNTKMYADHITPLVKEYYQSGKINQQKMVSLEAVQPQCASCSAKQGGSLSAFSKSTKQKLGL